MNDWPAPSGLTEGADYGPLPAPRASSCGSPSTSSSGGGMMALLLGRGGAGAGGEEDDSTPTTNSSRYLHSDLPPGSWGRSSPSTTLPSSSSALSSFGSYPLPVHQHQGTTAGSASLGLPSSTSSPLRLSGSSSGGDDTPGPYCLPLPRPMALPSFEPMQLGQASAPSPSLPSPAATPGSSFSPFPPQMMDFLPLRSSMSSSMPDIFRPSLLFDPSTTSSASSSASSSPSYAFPLGDSGSYPSSSASSGSSSFSLTPPTHLPSSPPTLASHREQPQPQSSAPSLASSNATTSTAAKPRSRKRSSSTTSAQHKPASSAAPLRRTASSEGQSHIRPVAHHHQAPSASSTRKPVPRRKMEEEYYHYLKEKLSRMESTRRKWQQQCMDPSAKGKATTTTATAMFDSLSPESCDMSWSSPDMYAGGDDFRKEEEQLYLSGAAMECFRHYYEKLWMFLSMESMQFTDEEWLRTVLKSVVCQTSPFALKINAILALGGLVSGQRQWADIFYDKWRRILTEFFDSSDYQVAEGLTVMSYYCFYQGDNARSRCYAELAAEIAVRARVGGGLMFIRAQTIIEVIATADSPSASSSPRAGTAQPLFLKKPLLTFPETVDEEMKVTISSLMEQLILASSRVHMWKSCQMIIECRERGRRSRKRRQSSGGNSKACASSKLPSPLHLLSVLQSIEDKLEGLEAQQRQASSGGGKSHGGAGGGRKGSVDGQQRSLLEASENTAFVGDMLAFARFVLFSVRLECHHEAGMNKNAFLSGEKILILLEKEESRLMRFVIALAPLVLSFVSPVLELFCGPLHAQFLNASDSIRAVTLLRPLREIFPTIGLVVNVAAS